MVRRSFFVFGESIFFFLRQSLSPSDGEKQKKTCTVFKFFAVGPENFTKLFSPSSCFCKTKKMLLPPLGRSQRICPPKDRREERSAFLQKKTNRLDSASEGAMLPPDKKKTFPLDPQSLKIFIFFLNKYFFHCRSFRGTAPKEKKKQHSTKPLRAEKKRG